MTPLPGLHSLDSHPLLSLLGSLGERQQQGVEGPYLWPTTEVSQGSFIESDWPPGLKLMVGPG